MFRRLIVEEEKMKVTEPHSFSARKVMLTSVVVARLTMALNKYSQLEELQFFQVSLEGGTVKVRE